MLLCIETWDYQGGFQMKKLFTVVLVALLFAGIAFAAGSSESQPTGVKTYKVGLCNFVDDASLNQIVENIEARLNALGAKITRND